MKVSYKNVEYEINGDCLPFENTKEDTVFEIDSLIPDFTSELFSNFMSFLKHKEFEMSDNLIELLSHMGYKNTNNYPLSYWKCKLHDNRFRECFESENLSKDSLLGLEDITYLASKFSLKLFNTISKQLPKGSYLAGEFLTTLFVASYNRQSLTFDYSNDVNFCIDYLADYHIPNDSDIEIYLTEKIDVQKLFNNFGKDGTISLSVEEIQYSGLLKTIKIKRRLYSAVNEIAYSFDIDAAGLVFADGKLYATHCARFAVEHLVNFYDEDLAGENYIERLTSFNRSFVIEIPQLDLSKINFDKLNVRFQLSKVRADLLSKFTILLLTFNYPSFSYKYDSGVKSRKIEEDELEDITFLEGKSFNLLKKNKVKFNKIAEKSIYGKGRGEVLPVISPKHISNLKKYNSNDFVFRVKGSIISANGKKLSSVPKNFCVVNVP